MKFSKTQDFFFFIALIIGLLLTLATDSFSGAIIIISLTLIVILLQNSINAILIFLVAGAVYNPTIDKFDTYLQDNFKSTTEVLSVDHSDWVIYSLYDVKIKHGKTFKINQILVEDNATATKIIETLNNSSDVNHTFSELTKTNSKKSIIHEKLLLLPELEVIAKTTLKPNEFTMKPVKTKLGYHILYLEKIQEESIEYKTYIGVLKNFWETSNAEYNMNYKVIDHVGYFWHILDKVF